MADNTGTEVKLSRWESFKLSFYWTFCDQIEWLKVLFTFRTKEQRQTWKAEMEEAGRSNRVTSDTTWRTPRRLPSDFDMKPFFKYNFSPRTYLKDMFSGWNIGWEKRAEAIYRGDV